MNQLKHFQTKLSKTEEVFMITVGGSVILDSWNYFLSLEDAETALFQRFHSSEGTEYGIIQQTTKRLILSYR